MKPFNVLCYNLKWPQSSSCCNELLEWLEYSGAPVKPCSLAGLCCVSCMSYLSSGWMGLYGDSPVLLFTVNIPHHSPSSVTLLMLSCRSVYHTHTHTHAPPCTHTHTWSKTYVNKCVYSTVCVRETPFWLLLQQQHKTMSFGTVHFQGYFLLLVLLKSPSNPFSSSVWQLICMHDVCTWFFSSLPHQ